MQTARPLDVLAARLKAEYETRLARIEQVKGLITSLRAALDENPELRADLAAELQLLAAGGTTPEATEEAEADETAANGVGGEVAGDIEEEEEDDSVTSLFGITLTDRIIEFFRSQGNRPATVPDIAEAIHGKPLSVRTILYKPKRNQGRFVRATRGGTPGKCWQLAPKLMAGNTQATS